MILSNYYSKPIFPVARCSYAPWKNIPVIVFSFWFQVIVKSFNNTRNPPFLFQSQPCSHFLVNSYSFFINNHISFVQKVWFIPANCDTKIHESSMFKFSFKSLKNIERISSWSKCSKILAEMIVRDHICLICQAFAFIRRSEGDLWSESVEWVCE